MPRHAGYWAYDILDRLLGMRFRGGPHHIHMKKIVYIVEYLDLVGLGRLHVSLSSVYSLVDSSLASTANHGLILVWGGWVLLRYIGGVTKLDRLAASPLGSDTDSLPWAVSLLLELCFSCPFGAGPGAGHRWWV